MFSGVYDAAGAMVVQMQRVNNITNNIANNNTVGFKKEGINASTWSRVWGEANAQLPIPNNTKQAENFINETKNSTPHMDKSYIDFSKGALKYTGNKLDFSIEDKGFFLVLTPKGIAYTRDGQFSIDKDGTLVQRGSGYPIVGENYFRNGKLIKLNGIKNSINEDGSIMVDKNQVDKIAIYDFKNYANLKKVGNNAFIAEKNSKGKAVNNYTLKKGYLEMTNISIVKEMVSLIDAQRSFERYQKVIDALGNDIASDVVKTLGKVS